VKTLDVGCGVQPKGDVNVDLYVKKPNPHITSHPIIEPKKIPNFVLADACHLPFRDGSFKHVHSSHVIEHVENPFLMLRELLRVSSGTVEIYTPHRLHRIDNRTHKSHFTKTWFYKALTKLGVQPKDFKIEISAWDFYPHTFIPLVRLPRELKVQIRNTRDKKSSRQLFSNNRKTEKQKKTEGTPMNGYDKVFILGLDGLEYDFVEKWNLMNLKQVEYGKIKVPTDEKQKVPKTPTVWAAFLTGKSMVGMHFVKPLRIAIPLKILSFARKYVKISLGLGEKIALKAPSKFPKLKQKTFLDVKKFNEINAPYYSYDGKVLDIYNRFYKEELTLRETINALKKLYESRKEKILDEAISLQDVDGIFAYMHFPDALQHLLFTRVYEIKKIYLDLDKFVSVLKDKIETSLFLIVSDHGFDLKKGNHSKHGFYSSNISLNPKPKRITDFYNLIVNDYLLKR